MINERLTSDIEVGAKMKPRFSTDITTTDGGFEVRNSRWSAPLHQFEFNVMPGTPEDAETIESLLGMFYAAGGAFETFLFRPWADYLASGQSLAPLGGGQYQLQRSYTIGGVERIRTITRPIASDTVIYVDGVEQMGGYTIDEETGIVTYAGGGTLTADVAYDVVVRFLDDEATLLAHARKLDQPVDVVLIEVKQ